MTIERTIDGKRFQIELTSIELANAHAEQERVYSLQEVIFHAYVAGKNIPKDILNDVVSEYIHEKRLAEDENSDLRAGILYEILSGYDSEDEIEKEW